MSRKDRKEMRYVIVFWSNLRHAKFIGPVDANLAGSEVVSEGRAFPNEGYQTVYFDTRYYKKSEIRCRVDAYNKASMEEKYLRDELTNPQSTNP